MTTDITTGEVTSIRSENVTVAEVPAEIEYTEFDAAVYAYIYFHGPTSPSDLWMDGPSQRYGSIDPFLSLIHDSVSHNVIKYTGGGSIYDQLVLGDDGITISKGLKFGVDHAIDSVIKDGSMMDAMMLMRLMNEAAEKIRGAK